jgi:adhesin transport system outer membrane protein
MGLARSAVDQAHQELARSKASLLPTLSLRLDRQTGAVRDTRVGLVLQSGLTNGLGSFAGVDAARSRIQAAEAGVAATEEDLFNRYQLEFTRYASAQAAASAAVGTAASSDQVLASYQRQFAAGKRAWLDLLNMVRENHATRQSQHDAAVEARASLYRLRILMDTSSQ